MTARSASWKRPRRANSPSADCRTVGATLRTPRVSSRPSDQRSRPRPKRVLVGDRRGGWPVAIALAIAATLVSFPCRAGDPFEIQVYDGTANAPGHPGLELHLNDWATGNRNDYTSPEASLHGQAHATLEPSYGMTPFWELGAYLETAWRSDPGVYDYAGVKLRSKFVTPPDFDPHWRFGVNLEVSLLPSIYDHDRWGSEIRPIIAWHNPRWLFVLNPILDQPLAGTDAKYGPDLEPALKVAVTTGPVALGFEYYSTLGQVGALSAWSRQQNYLFEVVDLVAVEHFELNAGVGEGLTDASAGVVFKMIVGYEFGRLPSPAPPHEPAPLGLR